MKKKTLILLLVAIAGIAAAAVAIKATTCRTQCQTEPECSDCSEGK